MLQEDRPARAFASAERYRTPGVYYEERIADGDALRERPGVTAFIGRVRPQAAVTDALRFTRWSPFDAWWRERSCDGYLSDAVRGFFANGGERCVVVPVPAGDDEVRASIDVLAARGVLEDIDDVDVVCVPDAIHRDRAITLEIQAAALEHCARSGDRFAILDSIPVSSRSPGDDLAAVMDQWNSLPPREGALYFPWIRVGDVDDVTSSDDRGWSAHRRRHMRALRVVPPSGHVAGIYARVDARAGVHKAPANEALDDVVDLVRRVSDDEQAGLNEQGINCLRDFPGRGIRVWGARTLSGQAEWRYVNVSRLFLELRRRLQRGMLDLVFEPNGPALWNNVRDRLRVYCLELFERGALKGSSPDQAFFVKCDAETNPSDGRAAGQMVAQIGLAAVSPLEFVVVQITRHIGGSVEIQPTTL